MCEIYYAGVYKISKTIMYLSWSCLDTRPGTDFDMAQRHGIVQARVFWGKSSKK